MKKILLLLALLFAQQSLAGLPPTTLSGQGDTTKTGTFNFVVPNKQSTKVTGGTLIETGNKNRLANPGFEHSVAATGWTAETLTGTATCSLTGDATNVFKEGKQNGLLTVSGGASGGTCRLYQSVNTIATSGTVEIMLQSSAASAVTVYSLINTANSTSEAIADTAVHTVSIPVTLGSTSSGISIVVAAAAAQTIEVSLDEAFVGVGSSPTNAASSSVNETNWASCGHDASSFVGLGTVTNIETECRRQGEDLLMRGKFSVGTATAVEARVSLPLWNGAQLTSKDTSRIPSIQVAGTYTRAVVISAGNGGMRNILIEPSVSYFTFSFENPIYAGLSKLTGSALASSPVAISFEAKIPIHGWTTNQTFFHAPADKFSTDTHTLTHKTTAIVGTDPVGTYNTYSYAASTNTKTICGTAPTTLPTTADGFLIYTRAYNAASTCGNPARVEIKIAEAGTSLPTLSRELYKNAASVSPRISAVLDSLSGSTSIEWGAAINVYDESTGVLTVDSGLTWNNTTTTHNFLGVDGSLNTSGYLVINAQKMKDTMVANLNGIEMTNTNYAVAFIKDVKADGTSGGSSVATTWNVRDLNTLEDPDGIVTNLDSVNKQFTLPVGTYLIEATAPAAVVNHHQTRLRNITDGTTAIIGSSETSASTDTMQTVSVLNGVITLTAAKTFELQHYTTSARATDGLGRVAGVTNGESEIYSQIKITRIK